MRGSRPTTSRNWTGPGRSVGSGPSAAGSWPTGWRNPIGRIPERSMSHVFPRVLTRALPTAVSAEGAWIVDADGRRYLDGAGGAVVVGVGHGDPTLIAAAEEQLRRTQYVHGTMFTTDAVEGYADEVAAVL